MDNIQKRYGYTGQGLRVNLTTGKITKEPTFPRFKDEIGGTALGYRVFWDEVPPKTQPLDEANKLVIAPGPFSGSGALCSSRTSITTIYPTIYPMPMIASAHIGGDMAARLKQAGYDFIIIEGKSENRFTSTSTTTKSNCATPKAFGARAPSCTADACRPDLSDGFYRRDRTGR